MPDNAMHDRQMEDRQSDPYVSMWRFASLKRLKHKTAEQSDRHGLFGFQYRYIRVILTQNK